MKEEKGNLLVINNAISNLSRNVIEYVRLNALRYDKPLTGYLFSKEDYKYQWEEFKHIELRDRLLLDIMKTPGLSESPPFLFPGYCDVCQKETGFLLESVWSTNTEGLGCSSCGCNSRLRNIYGTIKKNYKKGAKVYISEMVTPFYKKLKEMIPSLTGSEYIDPEFTSGSFHHGIRHEDSTKLSFKDNTFDMYVSNDVFEHVFNFRQAFKEAARVLKQNGKMIFHVPFHLDLDKTVIRAKRQRDGDIKYLLDPIYHGNPLSNKGSLCVQDFGWDMFDILKDCGFKRVYAISKNDMYKGYLNVTSLVFIAEKGYINLERERIIFLFNKARYLIKKQGLFLTFINFFNNKILRSSFLKK